MTVKDDKVSPQKKTFASWLSTLFRWESDVAFSLYHRRIVIINDTPFAYFVSNYNFVCVCTCVLAF